MNGAADLAGEKRALRARLRAVLAATGPAELEAASRAITDHMERWEPWRRARAVMLFAPLPGEIDLRELGERALARGGVVALPRIDWDRGVMTPTAVESVRTGLVIRRHGVPEPGADAPAVPLHRLDVVVVPGLGFDAQGNRLGRGAGFYDRFLAQCAAGGAGAMTVGVGLEAQVVGRIPRGPGDVPVAALATPAGVRLAVHSRAVDQPIIAAGPVAPAESRAPGPPRP